MYAKLVRGLDIRAILETKIVTRLDPQFEWQGLGWARDWRVSSFAFNGQ
jgi:hypothetical protein